MSPPSLPRPTAALDAVPLVSSARRTLASSLRSRVAGDDAAERARVIWDTPGERWFTPEDVIWRVHADASMFVGGIRALLVQSLHPLAMAGVAAHSGYKGDPWGRLQRTSTFLATTTFGTVEHAEAIIARVRAVHERVRGTAPDGRPYAASDPHLLRWVHITEVDSFLVAYQRFGAGPLTADEADRYVAQASVVATRLRSDEARVRRAEDTNGTASSAAGGRGSEGGLIPCSMTSRGRTRGSGAGYVMLTCPLDC
jgi:hypothetical protein